MSRRGGHVSSISQRGGRLGASVSNSARATPDVATSGPSSGLAAPSVSANRSLATSATGAPSSIVGLGNIKEKDPSGRIQEWSSPDDKCPICSTDRYLNPKLRLLVGPCYHKMCESCIDRIFSLGPAPCPTCGRTCRKNQFGFQTFEDLQVEREVALRKTIVKKCSKSLNTDFDGDLKAYNDYLDEVETITFNLINGIDEERCWAWINAQESSNRNSVLSAARNAERQSEVVRELDEFEKEERKQRMERLKALEQREVDEKEKENRKLVELLERGKLDANEVQRRRKDGIQRRALEREEEEEAIEREFNQRAQDRLAEIAAGSAASKKKKSENEAAKSTAAWGPHGFHPEMLLDFRGPLAPLDDGRIFVGETSRPNPSLDADVAMTKILVKAAVPNASTINSLPREEVNRMRASGYSWPQALGRDHQQAFMTLAFATPEIQQSSMQ